MLYSRPMNQQRGHAIGLTGNIACGKSTVARRLAEHGALVIDADLVARELMTPGQPSWQAVVQAFGDGILSADQTIDRAKLAGVVFTDRDALLRLNAAVHPNVHAELLRRLAELAPGTVAVIEAVALIEAGTQQSVDALWLVLSRPAAQIARLMQARALTYDQAAQRVNGQPPAEAKVELADVVLENTGTLDDLLRATDQAWEQTLARWGQRAEEVTRS